MFFEGLRKTLNDLVFTKKRRKAKEQSRKEFRERVYEALVKRLEQFEFSLSEINRPILAVFDSFEELQFHNANKILLETIQEISQHIPRIRPIFVGRAEINYKKVNFDPIRLESFDQESAENYLKNLGIKDASFRNRIYHNLGGSPLTLQLAAILAKKEGIAGEKEVSTEQLGQFFQDLEYSTIQGELVKRNLDHVHDRNVRKIAIPGLLVRNVNEEVIQKILAETMRFRKNQ